MSNKYSESQMYKFVLARPAGRVTWTRAMETKLYLLVNCQNWKGWVNVSRLMSRFINRKISPDACRSKWYRVLTKQGEGNG